MRALLVPRPDDGHVRVRAAGLLVLLVLLTQGACSVQRPPAPPGSPSASASPAGVEVAVWGSSSAQLIVGQGRLAQTLGVAVYNGGAGGELSSVIAARQGGSPAMLEVVGGAIPATGDVAVRTATFAPPRAGFTLGGTLAGVAGTLRTSGRGYVFARRSAGPEVHVTGTAPLISNASVAHGNDVTLLWMGKNDVSVLAWRTAAEKTRAAWTYAQAHAGRVLVLGHFADADMVPGSAKRDAFDQLQRAYVADYGAAFVDVEAYVGSAQIWTDTATTPTAADLAAQRQGTLPPSLDDGHGQHLSPDAYRAVGERLVRPRLLQLGWIP